jgi:transposase
MNQEQRDREKAIKAYLRGEPVSQIAVRLKRSRRWVYQWIGRYENRDAEGAWAEERSRRPRSNPRQVPAATVEAVKLVRQRREQEGLFRGAQAIHWELEELAYAPLPSLRTISRVLNREGLVKRRTGRYEAKGKKYPRLIFEAANDVHQTDFVGPCYLRGPVRFYSLNSVDLATGRCAVTPLGNKAAQSTINAMWANWQRLGIPRHQQVDNEMVFYGSPQHPRGMGCLIRLCLREGVEPWFIPLGQPWYNGVVEKFNDIYQQALLDRIKMTRMEELEQESLHFEQKHNRSYRYSKLQGRTPLQALGNPTLRLLRSPEPPQHPLPKPVQGRYHLVRYIRSNGTLDIFSEKFKAPPEAQQEYVIATVDVERQKLSVILDGTPIDEHDYALR